MSHPFEHGADETAIFKRIVADYLPLHTAPETEKRKTVIRSYRRTDKDNRKKDDQWGMLAIFASVREYYSKRAHWGNEKVAICQQQLLAWMTTPLEDSMGCMKSC
jgi:hypothetical protein